ncbi:MAG: hypothetical protein JWO59_1021 [Chloroflexi bacterium]|nr:hypothetical protein [Chloroflexota bacterium]
MEIVDACPNDLTVQDVARIAGRSVKTVRRAVHAGQLPMRYVLGLRGPQLVFQPEEIERWQVQRTSGATLAKAGRKRQRGGSRKLPGVAPKVAALVALLEEQKSTISYLTERLAEQEARLDKASALLAELVSRLGDQTKEESVR